MAIVEEAKLDNFDQQLAKSKMSTLRNHLQALLQKKIRIDLEIKRTKKKLSKLKTTSQTYIKTRVSFEGFDYDHLDPSTMELLKEKIGQDNFLELQQIDEQVYLIEELLDAYSDIPLYEDD